MTSVLTRRSGWTDAGDVVASTSMYGGVYPTHVLRSAEAPAFRVTFPGYSPPAWLTAAVDRLAALISLDEGWDSYKAAPVSRDTAATALGLLVAVMSAVPSLELFIAPLSDGGLQIEWTRDGTDIGVIVRPDHETTAYVGSDDEEVEWSLGSSSSVARLAQALRSVQ